MRLMNTGDSAVKPSIFLLTYGEGGVGKTTFAATAPKPILADFEGGSKYLGLRGVQMDVAMIQKWSDMKEFLDIAKSDKYETIVLDPLGEMMDKLKTFLVAQGDSKNVQRDGSLTMAGWGYMKKVFRDYLKVLRDSGKHVILIAHLEEKQDEGRLVKRPKIETKIADDIVNMVDVVGYFTVVQQEGETKRVIIVDPGNDKYTAKDRTGQLGKYIEPDFSKIVNACQGTATYAWSKPIKAPTATQAPQTSNHTTPPPIASPVEPQHEPEATAEEVDELVKAFDGEVEPPPLANAHLQAAREKIKQAK